MGKAKKNTPKEVILANTHVPDKVYAYSLQVRHALFELQNCSSNDVVSVEVLEDVAIEKSDGTVDAIQLKSVTSSNNPVSNRAKDLWKTLYNWLLSVLSQELVISNTNFTLFITAEREGAIVNSFNSATTLDKAKSAWDLARQEFYCKETGKEKEFSDEYALYVRSFFKPENKLVASQIIQKFYLKTIQKNHTAYIFDKFCERAMLEDDLGELLFIYMLGWVEKKLAELVENKQAMCISFQEYKAELIAIRREHNQKQSLKELAPRPTEQEVQNEMSALRRYVEQLDIVDCDYTEKIEAINDYLRASTNRTIWAKRGDISAGNLTNYQETLVKKWSTKQKIMSIQYKHLNLTAEEFGKLLYLECKNEPINIDHLYVPDFFTGGCYHALSDELVIGWHSNYKDIFMPGSGIDVQLK